MSILKKFFILGLSLGLTFAMIACDDEDECDGGECASADGGPTPVGDSDVVPESLQYLAIMDTSTDENGSGTPGVDICGVYAVCGDVEVTGTAVLTTDDDNICGDGDDGCSTARDDASAAEDKGDACDGGSNPSDYVSLGMGGTLVIDFGQDVDGCDIHVIEISGGDAEGADVLLCSNPDDLANSCTTLGSFSTDGSGGGAADDNTF